MSTMTKARPGIAVSGFLNAQESGSDENVPDSNESSFEEEADELREKAQKRQQDDEAEEEEEEDISEAIKNPFEPAPASKPQTV